MTLFLARDPKEGDNDRQRRLDGQGKTGGQTGVERKEAPRVPAIEGPLRGVGRVGGMWDQPAIPPQSTNAWSQQLGIIGIFDDDWSLWVSSTYQYPSCYHLYHFITLPRETLTHKTHQSTWTHLEHAREKRLSRPPTPAPGMPTHKAPSEPNRTPNFPRQR